MEILENRDQWLAGFQEGWLKHYQETGETNWRLYSPPRNVSSPARPGIDLSQSRLLFVTTAGAYLKGKQEPFDAVNDLGDYTIRTIPIDTAPQEIAFAHTHYDHTAVNSDQQVLLPFGHLQDLVEERIIGELAPSIVSFMGYQPVATRTIDETFPPLLEAAQAQQADAVFLVPS